VYGSGGRAASAIARLGTPVSLYGYMDSGTLDILESRAVLEGITVYPTTVQDGVQFSYHHPLDEPRISLPKHKYSSIDITAEHLIRFGMLEGDAIVHCNYAVYDPQNAGTPVPFDSNGSSATHLALVLNYGEAIRMAGSTHATPNELAKELSAKSKAEVVIIKMGAHGSLVFDNGQIDTVPAYHTDHVWKIGSGDTFVGVFGREWMITRRPALEAAHIASRATAYYCLTSGFPSQKELNIFSPVSITVSDRYREGYLPTVYLAGPFFTLAQLWIIEQARNILLDMGLHVFSPYHDVGHGSAADVVQHDIIALNKCDLMFAIGDGLDSGTMFEIGYARSQNKPVIMYVENESDESKKMMEGTDCIICDDFTTAIYETIWQAVAL
jgi:nucleoside 2-deoxyribosyltransferase